MEFIKADYEKILDKTYFDSWRWQQVQSFIQLYYQKNQSKNCDISPEEIEFLKKRIYDLENSNSYKIGHLLMIIPGKIKRIIKRK